VIGAGPRWLSGALTWQANLSKRSAAGRAARPRVELRWTSELQKDLTSYVGFLVGRGVLTVLVFSALCLTASVDAEVSTIMRKLIPDNFGRVVFSEGISKKDLCNSLQNMEALCCFPRRKRWRPSFSTRGLLPGPFGFSTIQTIFVRALRSCSAASMDRSTSFRLRGDAKITRSSREITQPYRSTVSS
jgi:hypothetical protein